jgi:hypothetical protein
VAIAQCITQRRAAPPTASEPGRTHGP